MERGIRIGPGLDFGAATTLKLGGTSQALVEVVDEHGFEHLAQTLERLGGKPIVLGRGSNILARDGELPLTAIRAENPAGPIAVEAREGKARVRVGAGRGLPGTLGRLAAMGLAGLEGLTGIPGRVGGAVAQNAGSYGVEFWDRAVAVRVWTPEGGLAWRGRDEVEFGYRFFSPGRGSGLFIVWEAELELEPGSPEAIRKRMRQTFMGKKTSQPVTEHTAGSVFKNPPGNSAGRLLDQAGFKGKSLGAVKFSDMHANFLVNTGGGTSADALELMDMGRRAVKERFGVELEAEVRIIG